jgi:ABC-2 type transport system ATP-binding protein
MAAIETTNLTKQYDSVTAVSNLDLTVEDGEVFGFLGPNGAGKSTAINVLLGFLHPTDGRATVLGNDATDESRAVRARTGLLPEGFEPYENLTGRQHIVSAIQTKGADDDPDAIIERVGLDPADASRAAGGYSTGMTQRLALGIALVGQPDLLILDEPSSGLDPNGIKRLRQIVRTESERGATVFFSSHILDHVEKVCERIGIMRDGELVTIDHIDTLRNEIGIGTIVEATVETIPEESALRRIEGVEDVTVIDDTIRIACSAQNVKMRVLTHLNEITTVRDFDTVDASLESVFEAVAGNADGNEHVVGDVNQTAASGEEGRR